MYICICNAFTDSEARSAIRQTGGRSIAAVYRQLACQPVCGKCKPMLREMIGAESGHGGDSRNVRP
jgi:bacterioferritin-associated ferredoxin